MAPKLVLPKPGGGLETYALGPPATFRTGRRRRSTGWRTLRSMWSPIRWRRAIPGSTR
jgi:hypothetical protein